MPIYDLSIFAIYILKYFQRQHVYSEVNLFPNKYVFSRLKHFHFYFGQIVAHQRERCLQVWEVG